MFSVLQQEKTALRDHRGMTVYRRLYLCDRVADMKELPVEDAPGSGAVVADGDEFYLLDHCRTWHKSFIAAGLGGCLWKS